MSESDGGQKRCNGCGQTKAVTEFYNDRVRRDGKSGTCKVCSKERVAAWARAHPERKNAHSRKYQHAHKERVRAQQKRWRASHPPRKRALTIHGLLTTGSICRDYGYGYRFFEAYKVATVDQLRKAQESVRRNHSEMGRRRLMLIERRLLELVGVGDE